MNLPKPANDNRDAKLERLLNSESWRNPEAVEDRVFEAAWARERQGWRLGDPLPRLPNSESWINPEAVEDRVSDWYEERLSRGLRLADPDPLGFQPPPKRPPPDPLEQR